MKVKELISDLEKLDPEIDIWVARDAEGNGFHPLSGVSGPYYPETDDGYFVESIYSESDVADAEWTESELAAKSKVMVIWP